jgi:hypothetical protein
VISKALARFRQYPIYPGLMMMYKELKEEPQNYHFSGFWQIIMREHSEDKRYHPRFPPVKTGRRKSSAQFTYSTFIPSGKVSI